MRGRDLIIYVEPHISIFFTDNKSFFNLDNLETFPGCQAPEKELKALKIVKMDVSEHASGCPNKKMNRYPLNIYCYEVPRKKLGIYR